MPFLKNLFKWLFDLEAKSMYTFKGIGCYWINKKKTCKVDFGIVCLWYCLEVYNHYTHIH